MERLEANISKKWVIKRYKDDPIYCSQTTGEAALAAWSRGVGVITLPGNISVSSSSISAIEGTMEEYDVHKQLGTGIYQKTEVAFDMEGNILTNWYKRNVGTPAWEKRFSQMPHYYKLVDIDNSVWAAMRLPEYKGTPNRSLELVKCTEDEVALLEKYS